MEQKIYEKNQLEVVKRDGKYFVRYDAGSHQEVLREDEITQDELHSILETPNGLYDVIIGIQRRLGPFAYESNWSPKSE